jgi:sulfur carrier protein ThiS
MEITVRPYADCQTVFDATTLVRTVSDGTTVEGLLEDLDQTAPKFAEWRATAGQDLVVLVNGMHVGTADREPVTLSSGDVVALSSSFVE